MKIKFLKKQKLIVTIVTVSLLLVLLPSCIQNQSEVKEICSLSEIQKEFDVADKDTLVVFDIDNTLLYSPITYFQPWFHDTEIGKQFWSQIRDHENSKQNPLEYRKTISAKGFIRNPHALLEPNLALKIIQELQNKGIKVIALTNFRTGSFGGDIIPSLPQWRYDRLSSLGINLSSSFSKQKIVLTNLTSKSGGNPQYYKGILLTDGLAKGPVLEEFLKLVEFEPKKILFIDDRPDYVESVKDFAANYSITFRGYIYSAVDTVRKVYNPVLVEYQLDRIINHDEFVSDEDARRALYEKQIIKEKN